MTANTAMDNIASVEHFEPGGVFRTAHNTLMPSGKGINAARTVAGLGHQVTMLGLVGSRSETFFQSLSAPNMRVDLSVVPGDTRMNMTIYDSARNITTHIQNQGFHVTPYDWRVLEEKLTLQIRHQDIVIVSGSLPPGALSSSYAQLISICDKAGARVLLDTNGDALREGILARPFMVKPNLAELEQLVGLALSNSEPLIIKAAKEIASNGVEIVAVSRGADGVLIIERRSQKVWKSRVVLNDPVRTTMEIGSGDAFVGGFAAALKERRSIIEAMELGVACGTANLFTDVPGLCRVEDVQRFQALVQTVEFECA